MESVFYVFLGCLIFLAIGAVGYFAIVYNGLVSLRENVGRAWANIDVILKQRFDELPKLISVCEGYAKYERATIERIVTARSHFQKAGTVEEKAAASKELSRGLSGIFALAEAYPELGSNEQFVRLQKRISHLEETLSDRRELYNDTVNNLNVRIQQFPDLLVARMLEYDRVQLFAVAASERQDVEVKFDLPA